MTSLLLIWSDAYTAVVVAVIVKHKIKTKDLHKTRRTQTMTKSKTQWNNGQLVCAQRSKKRSFWFLFRFVTIHWSISVYLRKWNENISVIINAIMRTACHHLLWCICSHLLAMDATTNCINNESSVPFMKIHKVFMRLVHNAR